MRNRPPHVLYRRVKAHRGQKRAIVTVAHQMLTIAYYIMRDGVTYQELCPAARSARTDRHRP